MRKGFHDQDEAQHQGLPVAGYVPQSDAKVAMVNEHKLIEERLLRRIDELLENGAAPGQTMRWLSIAKTNLELGFMALNRAVFMPQRVKLPEDTDVA